MQHIYTIDEIKSINMRMGQYWFSPDTMRFFKSRVSDQVYQGKGGIYFVTSEKGPLHGVRMYTVRRFYAKSGRVETAGTLYEMSRNTAHRMARRLAAGEKLV